MVSLSALREPVRLHIETNTRSLLHKLPAFISPALLTWGNLFFSIWAGIAFSVHLFGLTLLFLIFAYFCDTFDGMIARTRQESSFDGYFLDASVDRLGEAFWFFGLFLSDIFPIEAVLILAMSSFLINYFRIQLIRIYGLEKPGFMEKGDRNVFFELLTVGLLLSVNNRILIASFWVITIFSVTTVMQLFFRGLTHSRSRGQKQHPTIDPIKQFEEPSDYYLGGT